MIFYTSLQALLWPPPLSRIMRGNLCLLPTPVSICIHFDALSRGVFVFLMRVDWSVIIWDMGCNVLDR